MKIWVIWLICGGICILTAGVLGVVFRSAIFEWMVFRLLAEEGEEESEE